MDGWRQAINFGIAIFALVMTAALFILVWMNRFDQVMTDLVVRNFAAIVGLPFAFVAAFVVVAVFRQGADPIEFTGFGFQLRGASGEIVLWVICFISISAMIRLLWKY